jgi:hypothetical protein
MEMKPKSLKTLINDLVKPKSVIPSHANEEATRMGKVIGGTRTETFLKEVKVPAHLPLSRRTMECDGNGRCQDGC